MCDCECSKAFRIDEYLNTKICLWEKCLIGKLVSTCENEILNTIETSVDNKKVTCEDNSRLITRFHQ